MRIKNLMMEVSVRSDLKPTQKLNLESLKSIVSKRCASKIWFGVSEVRFKKNSTPSPWKCRKTTSSAIFCATGARGLNLTKSDLSKKFCLVVKLKLHVNEKVRLSEEFCLFKLWTENCWFPFRITQWRLVKINKLPFVAFPAYF